MSDSSWLCEYGVSRLGCLQAIDSRIWDGKITQKYTGKKGGNMIRLQKHRRRVEEENLSKEQARIRRETNVLSLKPNW